MYFQFLLLGLIGTLAVLWHHATAICASAHLDAAGVDAAQESFLYFVWACVTSFALCWFIPLASSGNRKAQFTRAVVNSIGLWFLGAVLAGLLGVGIVAKGPETVATKSVAETVFKEAPYDQMA
jgi:hypothetical protein